MWTDGSGWTIYEPDLSLDRSCPVCGQSEDHHHPDDCLAAYCPHCGYSLGIPDDILDALAEGEAALAERCCEYCGQEKDDHDPLLCLEVREHDPWALKDPRDPWDLVPPWLHLNPAWLEDPYTEEQWLIDLASEKELLIYLQSEASLRKPETEPLFDDFDEPPFF